jgi:cysteine desulfurase / selenocysteine lyase
MSASELRAIDDASTFDVERVRADFPALDQSIHGHPLVYLDSAATTLKPRPVLDALLDSYSKNSANVHRGVHTLSQRATDDYEAAREKVRAFIGAREAAECVFVRGTTEGIGLVAACHRESLRPGDEILITWLEHHSNIVPWQMLCQSTGARLRIAKVSDAGEVTLEALRAELSDRTRIVATAHVSNTLGTVLPVREIAALAHSVGAICVIDGAQGTPHLSVDVEDIGCDFYAFSGHKLYGPTGVGVLYGRRELFEALPPYQGGGSMIRSVSFEGTTYRGLPERFEAGTPHIAGAIGMGAAIDYLTSLDLEAVRRHEDSVLAYGTKRLSEIPGLRLIGTAKDKVGVLSFVMESAHPHDIGTVVDMEGVAIRTGHHCTQPLIERFGVPATARASLGIYNRMSDMDALANALLKVHEMFA